MKVRRIISIVVLVLGMLILHQAGMLAQNVKREGNKFVTVKQDTATKQTDFVFVDKDGNAYPIYLSPKGKAFIICRSKKTGKEYKRYLPKVTEELQKNDYGKSLK